MTNFIFFTIIFVTLQCSMSQKNVKFFRNDYDYNSDMESFYRVVTDGKNWEAAKSRCENEWSTLFYPRDETEAQIVINLTLASVPNFNALHIGISDFIVKRSFVTIEGHPISNVYHNWSPGEPNNSGINEGCVEMKRNGFLNDINCNKTLPFVCKKTLATLEWNINCDIPDKNYKYDENLERCYKVHKRPSSWVDAYITCQAEKSYLSVVNSREEANHLIQMVQESKKVSGNYLKDTIHLGIVKRNSDWYTTTPVQLLEKAGYAEWDTNQPDGDDDEKCGSMLINGKLNDLNCEAKALFVCEHEPDTRRGEIEERFGTDDK